MESEVIVTLVVFWAVGALFTWGVSDNSNEVDVPEPVWLSAFVLGVLFALLWPYYLGRFIGQFMRNSLQTRCHGVNVNVKGG